MGINLPRKCFQIIAVLITVGWIFSGWPQIWNFPPKIEKARAYATLQYVGGASGAGTGATYSVSLTALTGGIASSAAAGDLVIVVTGWASAADGNPGVTTPTGFTEVYDLYKSDTRDVNMSVNWKIMGGIPDTSVTVSGFNNAANGGATVVHVWRGADQTTPMDVTPPTGVTAGNAALPNSPSITPVTAGAYVLSVGMGTDDATPLTQTAPTGYGNARSTAGTGSTMSIVANIASKAWTSGAEDPATWTGGETSTSDSWAAGTLAIRPAVSAPTVTTQAASSVEATTATGNGNITDTGGANATAWGVCYKTSSPCTTADSTAAGSGTGGTEAFTASMTGLTSGTTYYIKAYATNSAGTSYGSEVTILTKPAAPTAVSATDGTYTDKVTITWTKSTGATDYHVWRDGTDLGAAGDVATFDDTGASAPTITAGSVAASDGTNSSYVELSLSGASANNGTSHTYKVIASNTTGNSADSTTDTGYRGVGTLTYQWQRSAADSDADYSNIIGATTASYNDTDAPSDGSGRYYKVVENATGATQQTSTSDRGYRAIALVSVSISDGVVIYGTIVAGASKTTIDLTDTQTLTNDGNVTEIFNIKGQNSACPWTLGATAGTDQYVHQFCKATDVSCASPPTNYTALTTSYQTLYTNVAATGTRQLDLRVIVPTVSSCFTSQTIDVTIQATQ